MHQRRLVITAQFFSLASLMLMAACAAEMPPPGGPADTQGPRILSVTPRNEMVRVPPGAEFEILFDELVDPVSVPGSVSFLPSIEFETRIRGRRIIIRPEQPLRENQAYVLTLRRGIRDYQRNSLESAQQLVFSTGETIPTGRMMGRVVGTEPADAVWVGLFSLTMEQNDPFQSLAVADDGSFDFRYLPDGQYRAVAVAGGLADFPEGMAVRPYAMPSTEWVDVAGDTTILAMQLSPPLAQPQIQSAEWVTERYMAIIFEVPFDEDSVPTDLLATAVPGQYGYVPPITGTDTATIALGEATGRLGETYQILPVSLPTVTIVDTLRPKYIGPKQLLLAPADPALAEFPQAVNGRLLFSEPIVLADDISLRLVGFDTVSLAAQSASPVEISFAILEPENVARIMLLGAQVLDLSGNALSDSLLIVELAYVSPQPAGQIRGLINGAVGRVIIEAHAESSGELVKWVATDSSSYLLEEVPPGQYAIFAHVQVGDQPLPYYSGRWLPYTPAARFAHYPDIIEVRPRWEVDGIDINFNAVIDSLIMPESEPSSQ